MVESKSTSAFILITSTALWLQLVSFLTKAQVVLYSPAGQCNRFSYAQDCQRFPRTCQWSITVNGCVPIPCELLDQQTCSNKRDGLQCQWSNERRVCTYLGAGPGAAYINAAIPATAAVAPQQAVAPPTPIVNNAATSTVPGGAVATAPVGVSGRSDLLDNPLAGAAFPGVIAAPALLANTVSESTIASTIYSSCWLFRSQVECLVNTLSESCTWANSRCFPASLSAATLDSPTLAPRLLLPHSTYAAATPITTALAAQTVFNSVYSVPTSLGGYHSGFAGTGNSRYSYYGSYHQPSIVSTGISGSGIVVNGGRRFHRCYSQNGSGRGRG